MHLKTRGILVVFLIFSQDGYSFSDGHWEITYGQTPNSESQLLCFCCLETTRIDLLLFVEPSPRVATAPSPLWTTTPGWMVCGAVPVPVREWCLANYWRFRYLTWKKDLTLTYTHKPGQWLWYRTNLRQERSSRSRRCYTSHQRLRL